MKMLGIALLSLFAVLLSGLVFQSCIAQADDKGRELILASMQGNLEQLKRLLDSGADVNAKDQEGWTPLAWAIRSRQWAVVKVLLEKGAEINGKPSLSRTAVIEAARNGHLEVVRALLDKGLEVDMKGKGDYTTLIKAIREGNLVFLTQLLEGDTKVDAKRKQGNDAPRYEHIDSTSKAKFFGVGGWPFGRDCPGIELFWKDRNDEDNAAEEDEGGYEAFFRTKKGEVVKLGKGQLAMFSPDCNYFWSTYHNGEVVEVFKTASGKKISSFVGYYPAWFPDSTRIYVSRRGKGKVYELWEWSLTDRKERKLIEVTDYCECQPLGDSVAWHPVEFEANADVIWDYPTCQEGADYRLWRVLTLDPSSGKIKKTDSEEEPCD
jgi:hypothetical protein